MNQASGRSGLLESLGAASAGAALGLGLWLVVEVLAGRLSGSTSVPAFLLLAPFAGGVALAVTALRARFGGSSSTAASGRPGFTLGPPLLVLIFGGPLVLRIFAMPASAPASALLVGCALGALIFAGGFLEAVLLPRGIRGGATVIGLGISLTTLVLLGTPSGTEHSAALYGVLKRSAIDWRWPLLALCLGLGAWLLAKRRSAGLTGLGGFVLLLVLPFAAALGMTEPQAIFLEATRGPVGQAFTVATRLTDRDGDGFSSWFGGGDCAPTDPERFPGAPEIPNNGIDEDCTQSDLGIVASESTQTKPTPTAPSVAPQDWSVLLLTVDTLRADLVAQGEGSRHVTPTLDQLAQSATVFENAYSLASYTAKSVGPLLIGLYPSEIPRTFEHFDRFPPGVPLLAERARSAQIATRSVQGYWYFFMKGYGLERGFDLIDTQAAPKNVSIEGDGVSNGDELATRALAVLTPLWQEGRRNFSWVHWVDPHADYVKHPEFGPASTDRERYEGEVRFVDAQISRVLDGLAASASADKTVVVITSDHGEAFGEHGMAHHGFEVWEELVRVPLIIKVPGQKGGRVRARRSAIDLAPTVLELLGIQPGAKHPLQGSSLMGDVAEPDPARHKNRPVLVDMPEGPHNQERRAFYSGPYKLITSRGRPLGLFNLESDPSEKTDLRGDAALLGRMTEELGQYLLRLRPVRPTK